MNIFLSEKEKSEGLCELIRKKNPLIHCITNPISMMQCANAVLGLGARPIMAEHPDEVKEITATASALLLNLGNISENRMKSMEISFEEACLKEIPIVIDAVGIACSQLRRNFIYGLLKKKIKPDSELVIKGNYSEIAALYDEEYRAEGVDVNNGIDEKAIIQMAKELSVRYKAIILASGKTDVVADASEVYMIKNGTSGLAGITGTGCMLGVICASFLAVKRNIEAVVYACAVLGIAGEQADTDKNAGSGSFLVGLLDEISLMTDERIIQNMKVEKV